MKSVLLIFFLLAFNLFGREMFFLNASDSLVNKGDNELDTLSNVVFDSLTVSDSLQLKEKIEKPLFIEAVKTNYRNKYFSRIKRESFSTEDYRNLSDIFIYSPFSFVQDLGSLGQPNEQMFYGLGFSNISYIRDGILLNNRWQNSFDLNKLNSERIDSIEVVPLTKGFLYSPYNNPVSVKLHSRFNFPLRPVTRLRYYQASYDEGFVDIHFNNFITNKINFGVGISNSGTGSRFTNSDYSSWKLDAKVAYLINDKINITANYFYTYDSLALFGGLDTNAILNNNFSTVLYGGTIRNSYRNQLTYNHNASVKVLTTLIPNSKTDLTFYYNSTSQKFRLNKDSLASNLPIIVRDNFFQTFGISFRNLYEHKNISLDVLANYESTLLTLDLLPNRNKQQNIFSLSGDLNLLTDVSFFTPSVFGKITNFNGDFLLGFGADITGSLSNRISYYVGGSMSQQQLPLLVNEVYNVGSADIYAPINIADNNSFEIGFKYSSSLFNGRISYFYFTSKNAAIPFTYQNPKDSLLVNELYIYRAKNISNSGININVSMKLWKFLFSNNFSYYSSTREERIYASPDYTLAGKLHYLDRLFENNLDLKVGVNYRFTGGQIPFVYDFEKLLQITNELTPMVHYANIPSSFQLDLFMAGTIQERATIFVTLENILDAEYYIAPYYFKQPITLRFGVSWLLYD